MKNICKIHSSDGNRTWRLIREVDENNAEEVVLRVQGIICSKTLPPIRFPFHMFVHYLLKTTYIHCWLYECISETRQRSFLRQAVTISGLGCQQFHDAVQAIHEIHQQFSCTFDLGSIDNWSPNRFEDHSAIDMSNRFFTPRLHTTTDQIITFSEDVDPDNILNRAMTQDDKFTHTTDNEVYYYELLTDIDGNIKWVLWSMNDILLIILIIQPTTQL